MKTDRESTIRRSEPDLTLILAISDGQFSNTSDNHFPNSPAKSSACFKTVSVASNDISGG